MPTDDPTALPTSDTWAAAVELAPMTDVWRQLLEDHQPGSLGRCRRCTQGGTGIPKARWPCGPWKVADAASRIHVDRGA
jgi:hypothetical protein